MDTKIFLASSSELAGDRNAFEILIGRKNSEWYNKGAFLKLVIWENFLDAMSQTSLQEEYNKAIEECDIFVMLFSSKVGKYTHEEFERAYSKFKSTGKPVIYTYFKNAAVFLGNINTIDLMSLIDFKKKLEELGHYETVYENIGELNYKFDQQLNKLMEGGFIKLNTAEKEYSVQEKDIELFDFSFYLEKLKERYQRLDLEGLTPPDKDEFIQLQLNSVFVEQSVRDNPPPMELPKDLITTIQNKNEVHLEDLPKAVALEEVRRASDVYYEKLSRPVFDVITDSAYPYIILLGDPGSGKSTLAKYVLLSVIDNKNNEKIYAYYNNTFPLLIELRSYIAVKKEYKEYKSFIDYISYVSGNEGIYPQKEILDAYLSQGGKALFIFDGLDEIFDLKEREDITRQIIGIKSQYPKSNIIITSRIIGYRRSILTAGGFEHFTLQDLDETQIRQFITKWYAIAFKNRQQEIDQKVSRILNAYYEFASIRQLSGNPMLLTIMAIISKSQELPKERWRLYEQASNVLIQHWDINRHLKANHVNAEVIDAEDKREMLKRLAFKMQGAEGGLAGNYIYLDKLQHEFEDYLQERYKKSVEDAIVIARQMIQQFRERNFILSLYGANLFSFVHRAFLEYFCALAFIHKFEKTREITIDELKLNVFGQHWSDQSWHEVLRIISGIIDEDFTGKIIQFLTCEVYITWPVQKEFGKQLPYNLSLALKCLTEVRNLHKVVEPAQALLEKLCLLYDYDMSDSPQLFSFIKQHILPQIQSIGASWPLGNILTRYLKKRIGRPYAYIYDRLFGISIGVLCKNNLEIKEIIYDYVSHTDPQIRVSAPFMLASAWPEDKRTLPTLKKLAYEDEDKTVRYAATYAIAEYYNSDEQTRKFLIDQLTKNEQAFARAIAVYGLATYYNADEEIFEILHAQFLVEKDKFPRTNIIKALGEYFHDYEKVFSILLNASVHDDSPAKDDTKYAEPYYVRQAALEALFRYWPSNRQTIAVLKDRAENEKTPWLKTRANEMLNTLQKG